MNKHTSEMNNLNNFKQPEALHLADYLEFSHRHAEHSPEFIAAAELRRLYAEVDRLSYQLAYPDNFVKAPEQEPVYFVWLRAHCAWMHTDKESFDKISDDDRWMLYTSPPASKPWVGLTDEDISKSPSWIYSPDQDGMTAEEGLEVFARAIEAKLREKNTE